MKKAHGRPRKKKNNAGPALLKVATRLRRLVRKKQSLQAKGGEGATAGRCLKTGTKRQPEPSKNQPLSKA